MPPTKIRIIPTCVRRTLYLIALLTVIALPCMAQRHTSAANFNTPSLAASACTGSQLSVRHEAKDSAMGGQRGVYYSFKNNSQAPCTLKGSPAFVLLNSAGGTITRSKTDAADKDAKSVTLAPGGKAFFSIDYHSCQFMKGAGEPTRKPCVYSAKVRIQAPGTTRAFVLREGIDPVNLEVKVSQLMSTLEELGISIEKPKP